jgi:hypothetical protein
MEMAASPRADRCAIWMNRFSQNACVAMLGRQPAHLTLLHQPSSARDMTGCASLPDNGDPAASGAVGVQPGAAGQDSGTAHPALTGRPAVAVPSGQYW